MGSLAFELHRRAFQLSLYLWQECISILTGDVQSPGIPHAIYRFRLKEVFMTLQSQGLFSGRMEKAEMPSMSFPISLQHMRSLIDKKSPANEFDRGLFFP